MSGAEAVLDVAVVGGGQAGLAMGYHLRERGRSFLILEAGPVVGQSWRSRWDSLRLFTPARYAGLPGMPFPGLPDAYPARIRWPTTWSSTSPRSIFRSASTP